MFDDTIKISSEVKSFGNRSCSLIVCFPHLIWLFKSLNFVSYSIALLSKPAAKVNVLKTDPNSYTPIVILFIYFGSSKFILLFKSESGNETRDKISPLRIFINNAALPIVLNVLFACINSSLIKNCRLESSERTKGLLESFNIWLKDFSKPEIPSPLSFV